MASKLVNLCVKHEAEPLSTTKNGITLGRAGQSAPRLSKASTLPDADKLKGMLNIQPALLYKCRTRPPGQGVISSVTG